jgi:hypothetical protein
MWHFTAFFGLKGKPGIVVGKPGKLTTAFLEGCFATVEPLPEIDRGRGTSTTRYLAFRVAGPKRDIEHDGC